MQEQSVRYRYNQGGGGRKGKRMTDRIKRKWMNVYGNERRRRETVAGNIRKKLSDWS